MTPLLIGLALVALCCTPITFMMCRDRIRRAWHRVNSRIAVEIVRHRTRHGRHTETRADVKRLDDKWADQLHAIAAETDFALPYERTFIPRAATSAQPPWETSPPRAALPPVPDALDDMVAEHQAVLHAGVIAALEHAQPAETATSATTLRPWLRELLTCPFEQVAERAAQYAAALAKIAERDEAARSVAA